MLSSLATIRRRLILRMGLAAALALIASDPSMAQSLHGSARSVKRAYRYAHNRHLHFYLTVRGVRRAARGGRFVRLRGNADYRLHAVSFPNVTAATRTFVERLAGEYRDACAERLVVTSAVRPDSRQPSNSSPESVHPTGIAVDLRRPHSECLTWLRRVLSSLEKRGVIDATEEHRPAHFHVVVFGSRYLPYVAQLRRSEAMVASADDGS